MKHVMLDLETLGTKPGCVFLSIAAVEFERVPNKFVLRTGKEFCMNVQLKSAMEYGLKIEASTLQWWLDQKPEVMALMFKHTGELEFVLEQFHEFKAVTGFTHPWGNSASFDFSILKAGYDAVKMSTPWLHWNEMCFRTFRSAFPVQKEVKDKDQAHNPLYDCYYQIRHLSNICLGYNIII